jgi:NDP-sugar pyrophosphorylase family protein
MEQAIILAGGLGTRLRPLTISLPKPMVPVNDVPFLEYQLRLLVEQDIRDIVLLTGYRSEEIEKYFGNGSHLGASLRYSREHSPLGTGGALRLALPFLNDTFIVLYGDSYLPIEYRSVLRRLQVADEALGVLVIYDNQFGNTTVRENIAIDANGLITQYSKGNPAGDRLTHVDAGVIALRKCSLDGIPDCQVSSLEQDLFPTLIQQRRFQAFITTQRFFDIGTEERLTEFGRYVAHGHHAHTIQN